MSCESKLYWYLSLLEDFLFENNKESQEYLSISLIFSKLRYDHGSIFSLLINALTSLKYILYCCGCIWGRLWLLVVNQCLCFVSSYRNWFLQINFHIYFIIYYYYYNLKITYYLLLFFCLAHHLMCWPYTSDDSFKPVEEILSGSFHSLKKILSESFQVWRKIFLLIFFFMLCAWHTLRHFVINKSFVIICVRTLLFIFLLILSNVMFTEMIVTSYLFGYLLTTLSWSYSCVCQ